MPLVLGLMYWGGSGLALRHIQGRQVRYEEPGTVPVCFGGGSLHRLFFSFSFLTLTELLIWRISISGWLAGRDDGTREIQYYCSLLCDFIWRHIIFDSGGHFGFSIYVPWDCYLEHTRLFIGLPLYLMYRFALIRYPLQPRSPQANRIQYLQLLTLCLELTAAFLRWLLPSDIHADRY